MAIVEGYSTASDDEAQAYEGLSRWAADGHFNDLIKDLPYDENNPARSLDKVLLEAHPSLQMAGLIGQYAFGAANFENLIDDLHKVHAVETIQENASRGISTVVGTLHLDDILDAPMGHNALFVASGQEEFAKINVLLANYITAVMQMTTELGNLPVDEMITYSGRLMRGFPDGASKYVPAETVARVNRLSAPVLSALLEEGVALHRAPSGTRAKPARLADGSPIRVVPRLSDASARLIRKRTPIAIGLPMDVNRGDTKAQVLEPRRLETDASVHMFMEEMVEAVNSTTKNKVFYGLPEGAELLETVRSV